MTSTPTFRVQTSGEALKNFKDNTPILKSLIENRTCWEFTEKLTKINDDLKPHAALLAIEISKNTSIAGSAIFAFTPSCLPLLLSNDGESWIRIMSKPWNFNTVQEMCKEYEDLKNSAIENVKKFVTPDLARVGRFIIGLGGEMKLEDYRFYSEFFKCVRARYVNKLKAEEGEDKELEEVDKLVDDLIEKIEGLEEVVVDLEKRIGIEIKEKEARRAQQWEFLNEHQGGRLVEHLRTFPIASLNDYLKQERMKVVGEFEEGVLRSGIHLAGEVGGEWFEEEWREVGGGEGGGGE